MPDVQANGLRLSYETLGDPADPALLLVMGLGAQLIDWPQEFCEQLAARGFFVIRFDNRDAGLSTIRPEWGVPDVAAIVAGDRSTVPYLLADLAADIAGLLDALGLARVHVVGASMGGMIAQQFTVDHPDRVASLCSIMSTTGRSVGRPTPEAAAVLIRPPAPDRASAVAAAVATARLVGSPGFPAPEEELVRRAEEKYDRRYHPLGTLRQYAAIIASPDRTAALREVTVPTVVVHGAADPLITLSGGEATAAAVPGAELVVLDGMGHDLPRPLWPRIIAAISTNTARAAAH
ncbi:alpha/beta fold hydrolase [Actinoplanes sp. NPDC049599]|uniref:alpha/beta fold hydrolase n=1 Tax=Actinoplanes sp. NPDC049599 TaxID=3363903 RepID=UPI0037A1E8AA